MMDGVEIRGGASEFEAAVIAVVLDHIASQEADAKRGRRERPDSRLPAWVRAGFHHQPESPLDQVGPD